MVKYGSLVKRLRRRPLTAETGVRFPYELLVHMNKRASGIAVQTLGFFMVTEDGLICFDSKT